jgi:hypothetical protein
MFGFIKKLKTVYEIPEPEAVGESALIVFHRLKDWTILKIALRIKV